MRRETSDFNFERIYDFDNIEREILENLYNINNCIGLDAIRGNTFEKYMVECCKVSLENYKLTTNLFFRMRLSGDLEYILYIYKRKELYAIPNIEFIDKTREVGYEYAYNNYLNNINVEV